MILSVSVFAFLFLHSILLVHAYRSDSESDSSSSQCRPFKTTFPASSVGHSPSSQFVAISPENSYQTGDGGGLQLFIEKPEGRVTMKNGANTRVAEGATINATGTMLYGTVEFEISAPEVAGVVTAVILIGASERDEIDIELLGGIPAQWQTNIFAPTPKDPDPHYGRFSSDEDVPGGHISAFHTYSIDWDADRIVWSVDGGVVRTLTRESTLKNGEYHYPSHPSRIQMGIWDASSPAGTAEWARGPIDWENAPQRMRAVIRSVTVGCPDSSSSS